MSKAFTRPDPIHSKRYWPLGVMALALVFRLWGIGYGLPYSFYADEAHFLNRSLSFGSGDLNPHWFHKPAFYMYLLFAEYGLYFCVGWLLQAWSSVTDFAVSFIVSPGPFFLLGRLTTAAFGLASIWGVYCIGAKHFGKRAGLIAALLLSLSQGHAEASRVIKADMPTACFAIWSTFFLLDYLRDKCRRRLALSCILAGVGAATKYYTILMLLPVCVAILLVEPRVRLGVSRRWVARASCLGIALTAFWGSYFVCSPYNFLDPLGRQTTFKPVRMVMDRGRELVTGKAAEEQIDFIAKRRGLGGGALDYATVLGSPAGMGVVIVTICLMGTVAFLASRDPVKIVFMIFPLMLVISSIVSYPGYAEVRHQMPLYPFLAVVGGVFVAGLLDRLGQKKAIGWVMLLLLLCHPAIELAARCLELSQQETRNVAKAWIEKHIPPGAEILVDENGPPLLISEAQINADLAKAQQGDPKGQFTAHYARLLGYQKLAAKRAVTYNLHEIRLPWWRSGFTDTGQRVMDSQYDQDMANPLKEVGVDAYDDCVQQGIQYAVVHGDAYEKFFMENRATEKFPAYSRFYHELFEHGELVKQFSSNEDGLRGPEVRIYKMVSRARGEPVSSSRSGLEKLTVTPR